MGQQTNGLYEFGSFRLDAQERLLLRGGEPVPLTPKAFDTLLALVRQSNRLLEKEELLKTVWPDTYVEESTLSSNIASIRKALGESGSGERYIETVPKHGYRFVAEVVEVKPAAAEILIQDNSEIPTAKISPGTTSAPSKKSRPWIQPVVFIVIGLLVSSLTWLITSNRVPKAPIPTIAPLTTLSGNETQPSFSPDGNQVAFVWNGAAGDNDDIYVKLLDSETPLRLTSDPAVDSSPAWSPDGRSVAFLRRSADGCGIYLVPSISGSERKLVEVFAQRNSLKSARILAWAPDGESLAIVDKSSSEEPFSLFLLSIKTGEKRRLTFPAANAKLVGDLDPAFSPDGKTLAFARSYLVAHEIYLAPIIGGEPKQLTFDDRYTRGLAWTPDGREIVFSAGRGGSVPTLWRVPVTGGTPEPLAGVGQQTFSPAIARPGTRLAYTQEVVDTNIWRLELPNSLGQEHTPTKLIASTRQDDTPGFSQDGKRIVFISNRSGSAEIWACDSDGAHPIQLTNFGGPYVGTPRLSPDGRQIVFDSRAEGYRAIFVMNADGRTPRRLTPEPCENILPSWSRDGRWIYFMSNRDGTKRVWKIPAQGGKASPVSNADGFEGFESPDGKFFYFQRKSGLWKVPLEGGEETEIPLKMALVDRKWAMADRGIYFVTIEPPAHQVVKFFNFDTEQVSQIFTFDKEPVGWGPPDLAVSPDGRWLLYTQVDQKSSDIMLIENFR